MGIERLSLLYKFLSHHSCGSGKAAAAANGEKMKDSLSLGTLPQFQPSRCCSHPKCAISARVRQENGESIGEKRDIGSESKAALIALL